MKIKESRCKCGHDDFFFADKGNQIGIYCSYCGKWLKWADKDEQNLRMKQESVIDKIRAEIEKFAENPDFGDLSLGARCGAIKAIDIIDTYRAESENT